mmetsp:Transcript_68564/g.142983  ORF Transcript_68564/g.142983 Transcript_68564/m.142983 type:complete len:87 (-) Transcript_68564:358-618(-)
MKPLLAFAGEIPAVTSELVESGWSVLELVDVNEREEDFLGAGAVCCSSFSELLAGFVMDSNLVLVALRLDDVSEGATFLFCKMVWL